MTTCTKISRLALAALWRVGAKAGHQRLRRLARGHSDGSAGVGPARTRLKPVIVTPRRRKMPTLDSPMLRRSAHLNPPIVLKAHRISCCFFFHDEPTETKTGQAQCNKPPCTNPCPCPLYQFVLPVLWGICLLSGRGDRDTPRHAEARAPLRTDLPKLAKSIADGKHEIGQRLPSERETGQSSGSRPTVREAIIALELDGLRGRAARLGRLRQ
jgi:hypothetical protein